MYNFIAFTTQPETLFLQILGENLLVSKNDEKSITPGQQDLRANSSWLTQKP
jgi:hypothetical protein